MDIAALLTRQSSKDIKLKLGEFSDINGKIADLLNVKYIVALKNKNMPQGYKAVYEDDSYKIFLNENALPRAFLVHNAKIIKSKEQILEELNSDFDFSGSVILEEDAGNFKPTGNSFSSSKVSIEKYEPNTISINVDNPNDGFLVLLDCFYPGWEAFVDGKPVKVMRADYIFRAVRVGQGKHIVKFLYVPQSLKTGFIFSAIFFVSGIVLCFCLKGKKRA